MTMLATTAIAAEPAAPITEVADVVVERSRSVAPDRDADPVLNNLERRTFRFFWNTANKKNGHGAGSLSVAVIRQHRSRRLWPDRLRHRAQNAATCRDRRRVLRVLRTLRFLEQLPQGPDETGMAGYKGFYYHFLRHGDGRASGRPSCRQSIRRCCSAACCCVSRISIVIRARNVEIRDLAEKIYQRVDWTWAQNRPPLISHRLAAGNGFPALRLARLQRSHAGLHSRARLADAPGRGGAHGRSG